MHAGRIRAEVSRRRLGTGKFPGSSDPRYSSARSAQIGIGDRARPGNRPRWIAGQRRRGELRRDAVALIARAEVLQPLRRRARALLRFRASPENIAVGA